MLPSSFFEHEDVVAIAKRLIGCSLHSVVDGVYCSGLIIEAEAYAGAVDKASHAFGGRYTGRTKTLYLSAGHMYVYLCYGMHHLFNIVTAPQGIPHAVLIRALLPLTGIEAMQERRGNKIPFNRLCHGPGNLTKAMGISTIHNGLMLAEGYIWIESGRQIPEAAIEASARIGVQYAQEDALLPYRFTLAENWLQTI
ncbi:MAG: DNA-3-methyladenine glycosylase [Bacteroidales bacterium]|nr:DNA-3-methyladenine glycosylase [Bacteroidales bacterium]